MKPPARESVDEGCAEKPPTLVRLKEKTNVMFGKMKEVWRANKSAKIVVIASAPGLIVSFKEDLTQKKIACFHITGNTGIGSSGKAKAAFDAHEGAAVLLLTIKAAGEGLSCSNASCVFLTSPAMNDGATQQAVSRVIRMDQTVKRVAVYHVITRDTLEEAIHEAIIRDKRSGKMMPRAEHAVSILDDMKDTEFAL